ncbi:MAG: hypothetical protein AAB263_12885 [Planctomycetota bacterium]
MIPAANRIIEAAEIDGRELRRSYSGRCMYGATCLGIVCPDPLDVIAEVGLRGARMDSMGRSDSIVYWPHIQADED